MWYRSLSDIDPGSTRYLHIYMFFGINPIKTPKIDKSDGIHIINVTPSQKTPK